MAVESQQCGRKHLAEGSLIVEAEAPVGEQAAGRLAESLDVLSAAHDWWGRPLTLRAFGESGPIVLESNLTLIGYEGADGDLIDVEADDDAFMAWMDLCVIVDWLTGQSRTIGTSWQLTFGGERIGRVAGGEEDEELGSFLVAMGERVGASFDDSDDRRAEVLDEAHGERGLL